MIILPAIFFLRAGLREEGHTVVTRVAGSGLLLTLNKPVEETA